MVIFSARAVSADDVPDVGKNRGCAVTASGRVADRVLFVRGRMAEAARACGRNPKEIRLCAVSKFHPVEAMREAVAAGVDLLGENRVQEAAAKAQAWTDPRPVPWHLLGHLQRNKARKAVEIFDALQSLDSEELALVLQRICVERGRGMAVLLEINISGEEAKTGVPPTAAALLLDRILEQCPLVAVEGFMGMAPLTDVLEDRRRAFAALRTLRDRCAASSGLPLPVLSMGMSDDYPEAIREGSTLVRVGSALFGPREGQDRV